MLTHQDYEITSHTNYFMCVNFIYKWRDLELKVDIEQTTDFEESFHVNLIYLKVFARNMLKVYVSQLLPAVVDTSFLNT